MAYSVTLLQRMWHRYNSRKEEWMNGMPVIAIQRMAIHTFFHKPPRVLPLEADGYHGDMPWYEMYTENNNKNNNNNNDTRIWRGMAKQLLTARSISSSSFPLCWLCRLINFSHYQKFIHPVGFCFSADYCYCWLLVVDFMSIRQSWRIFEWMNVGMGPANEGLVAVQIAESRELYI